MAVITIKTLLICCCALALRIPLVYAQNDSAGNPENIAIKTEGNPSKKQPAADKETTKISNVPPAEEKNKNSFLDFINKKAYAETIEKNDEKKKLREKWEELTGVDVFYPYFKAKEIEDWVSEKFKVKIFKIRGRLKLSEADNQIKYVFSIKF